VPRLELFPFRYRNQVTGKWVRARYVATREEIAGGNTKWEIIGLPEIRDVDPDARYFTAFRVTPARGGDAHVRTAAAEWRDCPLSLTRQSMLAQT